MGRVTISYLWSQWMKDALLQPVVVQDGWVNKMTDDQIKDFVDEIALQALNGLLANIHPNKINSDVVFATDIASASYRIATYMVKVKKEWDERDGNDTERDEIAVMTLSSLLVSIDLSSVRLTKPPMLEIAEAAYVIANCMVVTKKGWRKSYERENG